jgi:hypothetical protein
MFNRDFFDNTRDYADNLPPPVNLTLFTLPISNQRKISIDRVENEIYYATKPEISGIIDNITNQAIIYLNNLDTQKSSLFFLKARELIDRYDMADVTADLQLRSAVIYGLYNLNYTSLVIDLGTKTYDKYYNNIKNLDNNTLVAYFMACLFTTNALINEADYNLANNHISELKLIFNETKIPLHLSELAKTEYYFYIKQNQPDLAYQVIINHYTEYEKIRLLNKTNQEDNATLLLSFATLFYKHEKYDDPGS